MKHLYLGYILSFMLFVQANAQKFDKAIVTDVNYLVRSGGIADASTFPFYFHHPEFIQDVHSDIRKYVKQKFKVDTVIFDTPNKISYTESWSAKKIKAKEQALASQEKSTVYLSLESIIQETSTINGVSNFKFTTRVKAYKSGGKTAFKFKNNIPFEVFEGENITGRIMMKEEDFYTFYLDGLQLALEGKQKKSEKRFIEQPPTHHYDDFLATSEIFYMTRIKKGYSYGKSKDNQVPVLSFANKFWRGIGSEIDFGNLFESNKAKDGYKLTNNFKNEEYLVLLEASEGTILNFLSVSSDVEIKFKDENKNEIGNFSFSYTDDLEGYFRNKKYLVDWNEEYGITEVKADNEMIMLIKMRGNQYVMWVKNSVSEEQLGDIFNLVFVYDFSFAVRAEAQEKAANDSAD